MICRKGIHPDDDGVGRCRACKAIYDREYKLTEAGRESNRRTSSNFHFTMPALQYGAKLLGNRRRAALERQALRRTVGKVSLEGRY